MRKEVGHIMGNNCIRTTVDSRLQHEFISGIAKLRPPLEVDIYSDRAYSERIEELADRHCRKTMRVHLFWASKYGFVLKQKRRR